MFASSPTPLGEEAVGLICVGQSCGCAGVSHLVDRHVCERKRPSTRITLLFCHDQIATAAIARNTDSTLFLILFWRCPNIYLCF